MRATEFDAPMTYTTFLIAAASDVVCAAPAGIDTRGR